MRVKSLKFALAMLGFALAGQAGAATYTVTLEGLEIDLIGSLEFEGTGTFTADAFEANVATFSITASLNGAASFEFTQANSTFGGSPFGTDVMFEVTADTITLSALDGGPNLSNNAFLVADDAVNGSRPNLLLFEDQLRYRTPNPPNLTVFETVNAEFVLGRIEAPAVVPLPASMALYLPLLALGGIVARRRRARA